ncbi:FAD binding domain-containing protein [Faecalimonas sp.]
MLTINNYVRPETVEEAYELCQKKSNVVLGGMLWLKMGNRTVNTAIDLCDLGLNTIKEDESCYRIGAMVSLRTLETHVALNLMTQGAFKEALKHIVGVQFRNVATLGGSLYGRFGFSDVLTLFEVLDARVCLHKNGEMSIAEFAKFPRNRRDILTEVIIPKKEMRVAYFSQRNTKTDFPVLACAVSEIDGVYSCAVGARPGIATILGDDKEILKDGITEECARLFGEYISESAKFDSNMRGSSEYRKKICRVLVRRGIMKLKEAENAN